MAGDHKIRRHGHGAQGLRALVTGGSDGIGLEAARLLAAEGARVAVASREPAAAAESIGATPVAVDLSAADAGERAVPRPSMPWAASTCS